MRESDFFRQKKLRREEATWGEGGRRAARNFGGRKKFSIAYPRVSSYVFSHPVVQVESCSCSTKPEVQTSDSHSIIIWSYYYLLQSNVLSTFLLTNATLSARSPLSSLGLSICKCSLILLLWAIYFRIGNRRVFLSYKPATLYVHAVTFDRNLLSVGFPRIMIFLASLEMVRYAPRYAPFSHGTAVSKVGRLPSA